MRVRNGRAVNITPWINKLLPPLTVVPADSEPDLALPNPPRERRSSTGIREADPAVASPPKPLVTDIMPKPRE